MAYIILYLEERRVKSQNVTHTDTKTPPAATGYPVVAEGVFSKSIT